MLLKEDQDGVQSNLSWPQRLGRRNQDGPGRQPGPTRPLFRTLGLFRVVFRPIGPGLLLSVMLLSSMSFTESLVTPRKALPAWWEQFASISTDFKKTHQNRRSSGTGAADPRPSNIPKLTPTDGELVLHFKEELTLSAANGHIIFHIELDQYATFCHNVLTQLNSSLTRLPSHTPQHMLVKYQMHRMELITTKVSGIVALIGRQASHPGGVPLPPHLRSKRQFFGLAALSLASLSLGLGTRNALQVALLQDNVHHLTDRLDGTIQRVNILATDLQHNAEILLNVTRKELELAQSVGVAIKEADRNRQVMNTKLLVDLASGHTSDLMEAIQSLSSNRLPITLFGSQDLEVTWDSFVTKVLVQGLKPVDPTPSQLLEQPTSFLLTNERQLRLLVSIPLEPVQGSSLYSVYRPDHALIRLNHSYWHYRPETVLLASRDGHHVVEVQESFLQENCHNHRGPSGRVCPLLPSTNSRSCLASLYFNTTNPACQDDLEYWPGSTPHVFQRQDHSLVIYAPEPEVIQINCEKSHYMFEARNLQTLELTPGCSAQIGHFHAYNLKNALTVKSQARVHTAERLLNLLALTHSPDVEKIKALIAGAQSDVIKARSSLRKLKHLVDHPLQTLSANYSGHAILSLYAIVALIASALVIFCVIRCLCKRMERRPGREQNGLEQARAFLRA